MAKKIEMVKEAVAEAVQEVKNAVSGKKVVKIKPEYGINTTIYLNGSVVVINGEATVDEEMAARLLKAGIIN